MLSSNVYAAWNQSQIIAPNTAATSGAIAAVSRIPNSMEIWWVAPDGSVQDAFWYEGGGPWQQKKPPLAPRGSAAVHGGIAAVSRIPNSMEVWWIGADGSVQDAFWYEGQSWTQFTLAPAGSASVYAGITAVSRMPHTMEVMWIAPDGSVWDAYWYEGQQWQRYQLAAGPYSASTSGRITAVSRMPNCLEVWWIASDGTVWDAKWQEWGPWNFYALTPPGGGSPFGGIAAVSRIPSSVEVWWIGLYGSVQDAYWYEGGSWNEFALAPKGSASNIGRITAVSRIPNSMEVWWTGADGSLQDSYLYQGGPWNQVALAPAHSVSSQAGIAAVARIPNSMEVWWIAGDGSVKDANWYDTTSFNIKAFSDRLENDLRGSAAGYAFTISYQDQWEDMRSGGAARISPDPNPLAMGPFVQFSTASLSKTITAAAALQLLEPSGSRNMLDDTIGQYLPVPDFIPDDNFKAITFRQLLQHKSGIPRDTGYYDDYNGLRSYVNSHPIVADKSYHYSNTNYALFRLLIPKLAGIPVQPGDAKGYADGYIQYVQQHVFTPIVLGTISVATDSSSGLNYHFPLPIPPSNGGDPGDLTAYVGSQGWVMSTNDLEHFVRNLNYTENVVSGAVAKQMRDKCMGYDYCGEPAANPANGSRYAFWAKGGFYPGCWPLPPSKSSSAGEFNSSLLVFSNGISVTLFVNSNLAYHSTADACGYQDSDPVQAVLDAFNNAIGK